MRAHECMCVFLCFSPRFGSFGARNFICESVTWIKTNVQYSIRWKWSHPFFSLSFAALQFEFRMEKQNWWTPVLHDTLNHQSEAAVSQNPCKHTHSSIHNYIQRPIHDVLYTENLWRKTAAHSKNRQKNGNTKKNNENEYKPDRK